MQRALHLRFGRLQPLVDQGHPVQVFRPQPGPLRLHPVVLRGQRQRQQPGGQDLQLRRRNSPGGPKSEDLRQVVYT